MSELRATTQGAQPDVEVTHISTALSLVRKGLGLAVIPSSALGTTLIPDLEARRLDGLISQRTIGVMYRRKKELTIQAQRFIEVITQIDF